MTVHRYQGLAGNVRENTSNDILIDVYSECFGNLLSDSSVAKAGIALLQFNDSLDEIP